MLNLARTITTVDLDSLGSCSLDVWELTDQQLQMVIDLYSAVLAGDVEQDMIDFLEGQGIDLPNLLVEDDLNSRITLADAMELAAAASLVASDGWQTPFMFMPNVPKMSRRKSDSGLDIVWIRIDPGISDLELNDEEFIKIASVKGTVSDNPYDVIYKLKGSLTSKELNQSYMTQQLRVLSHRLREQGLSVADAGRVYLFLRGFPSAKVHLVGVAAVDAEILDRAVQELRRDESDFEHWRKARLISVPEISLLSDRCP